MPTYAVTTILPAPPEEVYAAISDLTRHPEWAADPVEIQLVEGDGGPGSRYSSTATSKGKRITADITVTDATPPGRFAFDVSDLTGQYRHVFTVTAVDGGSQVERRISASLSASQAALFYLVYLPVKRPNARRALANLATRFGSPS
ncbi:MAG: Polyketide cyclase / dehydrase and lipid transport [Chloroflexota bacterium]|nr:Polyketide cyclase / dehydrase and lipid transport [Chloroflexota bacterium]